jgi:uncharacterized protein (DUF433 family)
MERRLTMTVLDAEAAVDKFDAPLYTQAEAARFLALSESTFRNWARGYHSVIKGREVDGAPILSTVPRAGARGPNIPFVGLAEGYALNAIRRTGVPLQRVRPALERLNDEFGLRHALASRKLFTDGAEVLFDYATKTGGEEGEAVKELVVVRDGQRVFNEVVGDYLQQIVFGEDGFATAIPLPGFRKAELIADVRRSFGQPIFSRSGVRLEDAISLFKAERDIDVVSEEYGIPRAELEDVLAVLVN